MRVRDGTRYGTGSVPEIAPLSRTRNRESIYFCFAFVRAELIDDPRYDMAEAIEEMILRGCVAATCERSL